MRPSRRRWAMSHLARFEQFEPRVVMSAASPVPLDTEITVESPIAELASAWLDPIQTSALADTRARYGLAGQGQTVAVIDTGIAYDHVALGAGLGAGYQVVGGYDFAEGDANPYDDGPNGAHGTHVAGIIGSTDLVYSGVAPGVDLVALRVFNDQGSGTLAAVEQALRWVHDNRFAFANPITTVNLSLGTQWNGQGPPPGAMLEDELAQLEADGIFVAVAAGNSFATYGTAGLSYPAASPYVVPVSSVDADGTLSSFSQRDARAIAAPGRSIMSTVPDYLGNNNGLADDFARFSGTSMAAPYVAGAAVLLREAYLRAGVVGIDQDMLYNQMVSTADTVFDSATGQNYLRLNLTRAIDAVMERGRGPSDPSAPGLYDPQSSTFYLRDTATIGPADKSFRYGSAGSVALVGDWNGDGLDTVGLYNPATSSFLLRNTNGAGAADLSFNFGPAGAGWRPVVGDFNGDGLDTVGLYDPFNSTFYLRNTNAAGGIDVQFAFGAPGAGWLPIVGDFNGDGLDSVGLYDPASSSFFLNNGLRSGFADRAFTYGAGGAGWLPVVGDFDGDGLDTVGLYAPDSSLFYLRNSNTTGYADLTFGYGSAGAGWLPLAGTWTAGTAAATNTQVAGNSPGLGLSVLDASAAQDLASAVARAIADFHPADFIEPVDAAIEWVEDHVAPQAAERIDVAGLALEALSVDPTEQIDWAMLARAAQDNFVSEPDEVSAPDGLASLGTGY